MFSAVLILQDMAMKTWTSGTQCVAKKEYCKPKFGEIPYQKADVLTIVGPGMRKGEYRVRHNKTGEEGLVLGSNLREREALRIDTKLSLMPWFHGKISGQQAVSKLRPMEDGLFLVRESIRHPGDFVLCVCFKQQVYHYRVIFQNSKLTIDNKEFFYNLIDMIEFYSRNKSAIATILQKPKKKEGAKSAETELLKSGWLLDLSKLTLGEAIGEGEFGAVFEGEYAGRRVAIKNIKCDVTAQAFLEETSVMTNLHHKNLVPLLGVILHNGLYIITELMTKGNLVNFLRSRGRFAVSSTQLLRFALDVCEGMEHLESKKLLHRDLAGRNILVSEDVVAKVSDFGLAKISSKATDNSKLPVKWTAPEALKNKKFSTHSDVWSYGVLLWEIFSYGRQPYPKMSVSEVRERVDQGYRMEPPDECPPDIYIIMISCWNTEPKKRPSFHKLRDRLEKELAKSDP
ncbi:megakaryocyte-associated tyrosine-protein kinase-like [Xyrauchen texanus]|uniref:megakaryocyte-associated tyrosine-protein kinase-like n=1 Tax=Xyrauchen texanus TaxID=154827 RepID=UPI002241F4E3|nr:megakaryocyte-associated tyrosine-protein kinase-like [Xyrauchen texanus]XP_051979736.1 megakaryocyte-associated tyrosine-protein kinase-like [Xyrauchen texanus]